jgi:hypothetical protein
METNRRDFFRKIGQFGCLSAMVGGTALLVAKHKVSFYGCGDNQFCKNCQKIAVCSLEQAKRQRETNPSKQISNNQ